MSRASWKKGGPRQEVMTVRSGRRWAVTLLGLALAVWLGWVIYQFFLPVPRTFVLAYTSGKSDRLKFPPLAFLKEDLAWLDELEYVRRVENPKFSQKDVANQLNALKMSSADSLLVYVVAQGVSDPRKPAAFLMEPTGVPIELHDLLEAVAAAPASSKLVVLDCQRLLVDARLGLLPNQFAQRLSEEVKRVKKPNLVVISTGHLGESTALLPRNERTLFGLSFENALRTLNEKRTTRPVPVRALHEELLQQMSHWLTRGDVTQSPLVFQGGKGRVKPSELVLAMTPFRFKQSILDKKAADKKAAAEKAAEEKKQLAAAKPAEGVKPAGNPPAKPALPPEFTLADEVWTIRDKLQSEENPQWPIVFAPHLWRELNATIADDELRLRSGLALREEAHADLKRLKSQMRDFERAVKRGETIPFDELDDTVTGRLGRAWNDYSHSECFASWKVDASGKSSVNQQAFRNYARALSELPDMLALMDGLRAAGLQSPDAGVNFRNRVNEIWFAVGEFRQLTDRDPKNLTTRDIEEVSAKLLAARNRVRDFLRGLADDIVAKNKSRPRGDLTLKDQSILDLTLRSTLWTHSERIEWRGILLLRETAYADTLEKRATIGPAPKITLSDDIYNDLLQQFKLLEKNPAPVVDDKAKKPKPGEGAIGARLLAFHDSLLELTSKREERPPAILWHKALSLVDARDASRHSSAGATLCMTFPAADRWTIEGLPADLTLLPNEKTPVTLTFTQQSGLPKDQLAVQFDADPGIQLFSDGMALADSTSIPVSEGKATLELMVQARAEPQPAPQPAVTLRVRLTAGDTDLAVASSRVRLPALRELELVANSPIGRLAAKAGVDRVTKLRAPPILTLPLYPNRQESWGFRLRNLSSEKRVVSVQLLRVPVDPKAGHPGAITGSLTRELEQGGNQFLREAPLQDVGVLTLEPGSEQDLVATPEKPKDPSKPAAPPTVLAGEAPKLPGEPVTGGIVFVVRDVQTPNAKPELFWVGWKWIHPRDYVKAVAEFDPNRAGRSLVVTLTAEDQVPPDFAKNSIAVRGRAGATGDLPPGAGQKLGSELTPGRAAEVSIDFPADLVKRRFTLDVDGWPRAFSFLVDCTPAPGAVVVNDDRSARRAVQFVSVLVDKQAEYFHRNARPQFEIASQPTEKPGERRLLLLGDEEPAAFIPGTTLTVRLEVDLPDAKEPVLVTSELQKQPLKEFYTDRRFEAELVGWKSGQATLATRVGDLQIENLDVSGRKNLAEKLRLELPKSNGTGSSELDIVYETAPPRINSNQVTSRVSTLDLLVNLELADMPEEAASGILRARVALSSERRPPTEDQYIEPKSNINHFAQTQFVIPTKELDRKKTYYLFGIVEDRVGNITRFGPDEVRLPQPPLPAVGPAKSATMPTRGTIAGVVMYRTKPAAGVKITLMGTGKSARSDTEGRFKFDDLKLQPYMLDASGSVQNISRVGTATATPTPNGELPETITVDLQ